TVAHGPYDPLLTTWPLNLEHKRKLGKLRLPVTGIHLEHRSPPRLVAISTATAGRMRLRASSQQPDQGNGRERLGTALTAAVFRAHPAADLRLEQQPSFASIEEADVVLGWKDLSTAQAQMAKPIGFSRHQWINRTCMHHLLHQVPRLGKQRTEVFAC